MFHASDAKLNTVHTECREATRQTASLFLGQLASAGEELAANLAPTKDGRSTQHLHLPTSTWEVSSQHPE